MPQVAEWLRARSEDLVFLSVITIGEIERGIALQEKTNPAFAIDLRNWLNRTTILFVDRLLPFGAEEAKVWGRLSERIGSYGANLQIAATALVHEATVVTGNVSDFEPTGVQTENPFPTFHRSLDRP